MDVLKSIFSHEEEYGEVYRHDKRYHRRSREDRLRQPRPIEEVDAIYVSEKMAKGCKHSIEKVKELEKAIETRRDRNRQKIRQRWQQKYEKEGLEREYRG